MSTSSARYVSTRGQAPETDFADALLRGIAPDGGLYMPTAWPRLSPSAWAKTADEPSKVSSTSSEGWKTLAALAGDESRAPVAPALMTAASDSRYMGPIADDIYRFQPLVLTVDATKMIHGTDEHISVANVERMVRFYQRLVETAASR